MHNCAPHVQCHTGSHFEEFRLEAVSTRQMDDGISETVEVSTEVVGGVEVGLP